MTRVVKVAVILTLVWAAYWFGSGYLLRSGISAWFETQRNRGWQAEFADLSSGGFPFQHRTTLERPVLADPNNGTLWEAAQITLTSPAIWPGHVTVQFPEDPQTLAHLGQTNTLRAKDMQAALKLRPGLALQLQQMALTSGPWVLKAQDTDIARADNLIATVSQQEAPEAYHFDVSATGFAPGLALRHVLNRDDSQPDAFEVLKLDMDVTFDSPWDIAALETRRPQPRQIDLSLAELQWGAMSFLMAGKLDVDDQGIPTGAVTIKAENWRDMLAMAQSAGAIPPEFVGSIESGLDFLAGLSGNRNALDVTLTLKNGYIAVGLIPIGRAPILRLR